MSRHLIQGAASWAARMEMRIKSMEELRAYDRALLESRNQGVYAAEIPPELSSLGSWLDEKTAIWNYESEPSRMRLNHARYGPTAQFLYSQNPKPTAPFDALDAAMGRWGAARLRWRDTIFLENSFIQAFAKVCKELIATGNPLEPFATPNGEVRIGVNDFPHEPLWTLYRNTSKPVLFDEWPGSWRRPKLPILGANVRGKYDRIWYYAMAQYRENLETEERDQKHLSRWLELARIMIAEEPRRGPFYPHAGLALRRWHWRFELRRQAIEKLDRRDRARAEARNWTVLGQEPYPTPEHLDGFRFALPNNSYEHHFGIRWGKICAARIRSLRNVLLGGIIGHGPTAGYFYGKAGGGDEESLALMKQWAEQEPPSYEEFLRQEVEGDCGLSQTMEQFSQKELVWERTKDFNSYYKARAERRKLQVRINDFPDERLYSLFVDGEWVGDFNDWPRGWAREDGVGKL